MAELGEGQRARRRAVRAYDRSLAQVAERSSLVVLVGGLLQGRQEGNYSQDKKALAGRCRSRLYDKCAEQGLGAWLVLANAAVGGMAAEE
jgi:hypothetical protein